MFHCCCVFAWYTVLHYGSAALILILSDIMRFYPSNYNKFTISASAYNYSHIFCAIKSLQYKLTRKVCAFAMHRGKSAMKGKICEVSNIITQQELYTQNTEWSKY